MFYAREVVCGCILKPDIWKPLVPFFIPASDMAMQRSESRLCLLAGQIKTLKDLAVLDVLQRLCSRLGQIKFHLIET